jgi:tetratricopeptide (TPR) repeat protein
MTDGGLSAGGLLKTMACIGTGKIKEPAGLGEALEFALLHSAGNADGILRILSQEATGRIAIRNGRVIIGAEIAKSGLTGYDAVRAFLSLKRGMYYYLDGEKAGGTDGLEQQLNIDIQLLLTRGQEIEAIVAEFDALANINGWPLTGPAGAEQPGQFNESAEPRKVPAHGPGSPTFGESFLDMIAETARNTFTGLKAITRKKEEKPQPQAAARVFADLENTLARSGGMPATAAPGAENVNQAIAASWAPSAESVANYGAPAAPAASAVTGMAPPLEPIAVPPSANPTQSTFPGNAAGAGSFSATPPASDDPMWSWPHDDAGNDSQRPQPPTSADGQRLPQQPYQPGTSQPLSVEEIRRQTGMTGQMGRSQPPSASGTKFAKPARDADERARAAAERTTESQKLRTLDILEEVERAAGGKAKGRGRKRSLDMAAIGGAVISFGLLAVCVLAFKTTAEMSSTSHFIEKAKEYLNKNRRDLAVTQLTLALEKNPNDTQALEMRATIYDTEGDLKHALEDYDLLAARRPDYERATLFAGWTHIRMSQFKEAIDNAETLLKRDPQSAGALAIRGIAQAALRKYDSALQDLNNTDESQLKDAIRACVNGARGFCYMNMKQPEKGARCYDTAISIDPTNDGLYRERAACYDRLGQYDKAIADLEAATKAVPSNALNYVELAKLCDKQKQYQKAVKAWKGAITLTPRPTDLYVNLAQDQFQLGEYGSAIEACDLALKLAPNQTEALRIKSLAETKQKSAKPIVAVGTYDLSDPVAKPDANQLKMRKAVELMNAGQYQEAQKIAEQAIKDNPNNTSAVVILAHSLLYQHKNQDAYEQFSYLDAMKALPMQDRFAFAECAKLCGHEDKALNTLIEALTIKPTWVEARVRLIKELGHAGLLDRANTVAQEGLLLTSNLDEKQKYLDALAEAKKAH